MRLTDPDQFRRHARRREVPLGETADGEAIVILMRSPTLSEIRRIDALDDDAGIEDVAEALRALVVADDGEPVFADAASMAGTLDVDQLSAIMESLDTLAPAITSAAKKSSATRSGGGSGGSRSRTTSRRKSSKTRSRSTRSKS